MRAFQVPHYENGTKILGLAAWTFSKVPFSIVIMSCSRLFFIFVLCRVPTCLSKKVLNNSLLMRALSAVRLFSAYRLESETHARLWILRLTLKQRWPWLTLSFSLLLILYSSKIYQRSSLLICNWLILTDKGCSKTQFLLSLKCFLVPCGSYTWLDRWMALSPGHSTRPKWNLPVNWTVLTW